MKYEVYNVTLNEPVFVSNIDITSVIVETTPFGKSYFAVGLLIAKFKPMAKQIITYVPNTIEFDINNPFGLKAYSRADKLSVRGESLLNLDNQLKVLEKGYPSYAPYYDSYKELVHEHFDYHQAKEGWVISLPDCELGTQYPVRSLVNIIDINTIFDKH